MEAAQQPAAKIELSGSAARYIERHGRRAFIWGTRVSGDTGMTECSTRPPANPEVSFDVHLVDGIEVHIASDFPQPPCFVVQLARFPRRRLVALWYGGPGPDVASTMPFIVGY